MLGSRLISSQGCWTLSAVLVRTNCLSLRLKDPLRIFHLLYLHRFPHSRFANPFRQHDLCSFFVRFLLSFIPTHPSLSFHPSCPHKSPDKRPRLGHRNLAVSHTTRNIRHHLSPTLVKLSSDDPGVIPPFFGPEASSCMLPTSFHCDMFFPLFCQIFFLHLISSPLFGQ